MGGLPITVAAIVGGRSFAGVAPLWLFDARNVVWAKESDLSDQAAAQEQGLVNTNSVVPSLPSAAPSQRMLRLIV